VSRYAVHHKSAAPADSRRYMGQKRTNHIDSNKTKINSENTTNTYNTYPDNQFLLAVHKLIIYKLN